MHSDVMAHVTTWSNFAMALPIVQMGVMRQTAITDKRAATGARTILAIMTSAATITTTSMSLSNLPHQVSTGRQLFSTANILSISDYSDFDFMTTGVPFGDFGFGELII